MVMATALSLAMARWGCQASPGVYQVPKMRNSASAQTLSRLARFPTLGIGSFLASSPAELPALRFVPFRFAGYNGRCLRVGRGSDAKRSYLSSEIGA